MDLFRLPSSDDTGGRMYATWASLRDVLHDLVENMDKTSEFEGSEALRDFRLLLLIAHYLATRSFVRGGRSAFHFPDLVHSLGPRSKRSNL